MLFFPGRGLDQSGRLAILNYLAASGKCKHDSADIASMIHDTKNEQLRIWRDTVSVDTVLYPLDTTTPSLQQLGLEVLLGPQEVIRTFEVEANDLLNLRSSKNPFSHQTEIHVTTNATEVVTFELFDALGRRLQTNYGGQVLKAGEQTFKVDGLHLSSGVYFVRVSTNHGMVKSLQLRKEE